MDGDILWVPPADARTRTKMGRLLTEIERRHDVSFKSYTDFWRWSVDHLEDFYTEMVRFCDVRFATPPRTVLTTRNIPKAEWFPGATLNFTEHVFRAMPEGIVVTSLSELRGKQTMTAAELRAQVGRIRKGLVKLGVKPGDRVAGYLPHIPETLAAFLAVASLGAIWAVCPPEFGVHSVLDRLGQVAPKVLLAVDGYRFGGKDYDRCDDIAAVRRALPSVEAMVWLPYLGASKPPSDALLWDDAFGEDGEVNFTNVPFDQTLYILFTSGTTGLPKAVPHSHGGIILEHHKWLGLHADLGPGDTFFWYSTTGWIVWNLVPSALLTGAAVVMLDGSPIYPNLEMQWKMVEDLKLTHLGLSTAFLMNCQRAGVTPGKQFDLSSLRVVQVGGSPFPAKGWEWFYENVRSDILVGCSTGGTDVGTTFLGGAPLVQVRSGRHACIYLGSKIEGWDESGKPVIGAPAELVVTAPLPTMPKALWGDPNGAKLHENYYSTFPGIWDFHDRVIVYEDNSCAVIGRSDATLNRAGVRLGPAEYYAVLESMDEVLEALVVHLQDQNLDSGEICVFVVLRPGHTLDDKLRKSITSNLASRLSPRHVPDILLAVADLPKTLTGKKLEVPIRRILEGAAPDLVTSSGTLANPGALNEFIQIAERRRLEFRREA